MEEREDAWHYPYQRITYKLQLILYTGKLLMENGAATDQIVRDMYRAAIYMELPESRVQFHIAYTTLMVNVHDGEHSAMQLCKTQKHGANMTILSAVSKLTWRAMREGYALERYERELRRIERLPRHYSPLVTALGAGLACGGFCKLFGCDWPAFFLTALAAGAGFSLRRLCNESGFNVYAGIAISAFAATMLALLLPRAVPTATPQYPMIAAALFIVPGIPLLNAVDDMLNNFIVAGSTRAMNTLLIISSMTFGLILAHWLGGVSDFTTLSIQPDGIYLSQAAAAGIAAMGFSTIFNLPLRLLPVVALGAILAVDLRNLLVIQFGMGLAVGSFLGAAAVGILAQKAIHWFHAPSAVLTIPSIIPMIPGVLLYRMLFVLLNITTVPTAELLGGFRSGLEGIMVIAAMAVGVTIPTIFFRPYLQRYQRATIEEHLMQRYSNED